MKISAILMVIITSVMLLLVTILAVMNFSFSWVFYLTCIGQLMIIIMVYKVLKDKYTTDKTFKDFYEDHPIPKDQ
ncbi:hypothetical protein [Aquimarina sp. MMG016]|uniref:hypothetical protein n=1 Tax=Aquimarina sp. MMG016 TaxID=2822690 RepID=UPI001B3A0BA6|nr:hypothetical protein [Aquimarina sp. MMG016]MBQ4820951.1 hypothetical protein [Aquimarina sp. MMG016]